MNLQMDTGLLAGYTSSTQKIRVITERWAENQLYCPCCGCTGLQKFENNRPVADFFCPECREQYELKSKAGPIGKKVVDGSYETMISRIVSLSNPNFFFLQYEKMKLRVNALTFVPKYFLSPSLIEKRPPLSPAARRAGWTGCSILYQEIPSRGRIYLVQNGQAVSRNTVLDRVQEISFLSSSSLDTRGWLLD
ncbi:MAG: DpnI domain-containing protein, partial [Oscillibacter sp.]|nr:DpnI domain-containing protein [Oscillibacter sp.]